MGVHTLVPLVAPSDWFMPMDEADDVPGPLCVVAPPLPAPYLEQVPQLDDEILDVLDEPFEPAVEPSPKKLKAQLAYERIKKQIFESRHRFEQFNQVLIVSEPPKKPPRE